MSIDAHAVAMTGKTPADIPRNVTEHSPLSPFDEWPIHQAPKPLREVVSDDPRAYERYWFTASDDRGEVFVITGFGFYPNLGTADAYAIVIRGGQHSVIRVHRVLGDDRADLSFGPLRFEPVAPFREWRLVLGPNEYGIEFDLRWRDTKRAVFHAKDYGPPAPETAGYESLGAITGTGRHQGRKFEFTPAHSRGSRDHHWGIRNMVGGPEYRVPQERMSHCGQWVEFDTWSIWGWRTLYNLGDARPGAPVVEPIEHRLDFDPVTKQLRGGIIVNRMPDGELKEVSYEQIGNQTGYLRCGMYAGPELNGTPGTNLFHGSFVGAEVVTGESYDLTDPAVRVDLQGFDDHLCLATCEGETTVGILECVNPVLYEMCRDGAPGFSFRTA